MNTMASFPRAREIHLAWVPDQHPGPFDFNGEIVGGLKTPSPHVYGGGRDCNGKDAARGDMDRLDPSAKPS